MSTDRKNTQRVNFPEKLNQLFTSRTFSIDKWRMFKIGNRPSNCELQELMLLFDILCRQPCYLSEEDSKKLENRIIKLSNV